MNRAERRRLNKENKDRCYTVKESDLKAKARKIVKEEAKKTIEEAQRNAVHMAMELSLLIPMKVMMEYYWKKSYEKRMPGFVEHMLEYVEQWGAGELDIEELRKELWDLTGIAIQYKEEG